MLTELKHRVKVSIMTDNSHTKETIERVMTLFNCKSLTGLANYLNGDGEKVVYAQTISRWLRKGMYKSTLAVIGALLDKNEALEAKTKKLESELKRYKEKKVNSA